MNYIEKNKITNLPCKYKLVIYFQEYANKDLSQDAKVILWPKYSKTHELEIDYLVKELFFISTGTKPFTLRKPTFNRDTLKHKGRNTFKKAIIYNTYEDTSILQLDYWQVKLAKDILHKNIPVQPPEKLYKDLEIEQKQDLRNFYASFGWYRVQKKIGVTYKSLWINDFIKLRNSKPNEIKKPVRSFV